MRQALTLFEKARDELAPRFESDHPTTLNILDSLAGIYRAFGRTAEAIALAEHVRETRMMTLAPTIPTRYTRCLTWD